MTDSAQTRQTAFDRIHADNLWGADESRSGQGSTEATTRNVRLVLPRLLQGFGVRSMLDAPCGDFHWMQQVDFGDARYIGCDIVPALIDDNRRRHPAVDFRCIDLADGELPDVDLIFSRDCLQHLPEEDIWRVLANFKRSGARWLLTSSHQVDQQSIPFEAGAFGYLNLQLPPFSFARPLLIIPEEHYPSKAMCLWPMDEIRG